MSAVQLSACEQIVNAMGPMIYNPSRVQMVLHYIYNLQSEAPCQFSEEEMQQIVASGTQDALAGKGMSHAELKKMTASWLM